MATPALAPSSLIDWTVRYKDLVDSTWISISVAPDFANDSMNCSGLSIIRWASIGSAVTLATASTTAGPKVRLGTKWPSITSTWIRSAPAATASLTCSLRRPMSAERIEGTMSIWLKSLSLALSPAGRGESGVAVDQPSRARNHPRWHLATLCFRHRIGLSRPGGQDDHPPRPAQRRQAQRHALGRWFWRVTNPDRPALHLQRRVTREQRRRVAVLPHSQQHDVERRQRRSHVRVQPARLIRPELARNAVHGRGRDPIQPRLARHPVVAFGMVGPYAALIAEQHGDPPPLHLESRQQFVAAPRRGATSEHERPRSIGDGRRDVGRRSRGYVFSGLE